LGAGDTFNAAVILALSRGLALRDALTYACRYVRGSMSFVARECTEGPVDRRMIIEKGFLCVERWEI
jgi:hydroxymethylpyrimidine/phosphomethylpyrimidine kinase